MPRVLLAVAVLAAAAGLTAWGFGAAGIWSRGGAPVDPAPLGVDAADLPGGTQAEARTGPATQLFFDTAGRCRRVEAWTEPAGAGRAGLDPAGLEAALPGWRVAAFAADRVHLLPAAPEGTCPDRRPFTLTIRDGEVVIVAGEGRDAPIQERSGIAAGLLAPGDLALLQNGHTVEGLDRAWEYLEGIAEHQVP